MASEADSMTILAAVLSDPQAAAGRLKELNEGRRALELTKAEHAKRLADIKKIEDDSNATYKKASEAQLAAARDLKLAEEKRRGAQDILDKTGIRESEVGAREEALQNNEGALEKKLQELSVRERTLKEREANAEKQEKRLAALQSDLERKLAILKSIAA